LLELQLEVELHWQVAFELQVQRFRESEQYDRPAVLQIQLHPASRQVASAGFKVQAQFIHN
jgi:hypothetical protein